MQGTSGGSAGNLKIKLTKVGVSVLKGVNSQIMFCLVLMLNVSGDRHLTVSLLYFRAN